MSILEKEKAGIPHWLLPILGLGMEMPRRCWVTLGPTYVIARSLVISGVDWFHHICWVITSTWSGYTGIPIPQKDSFYTVWLVSKFGSQYSVYISALETNNPIFPTHSYLFRFPWANKQEEWVYAT